MSDQRTTPAAAEPGPDRVLGIAEGFWAAKTLMSAVELRLFSVLAREGPLDSDTLRDRLGLHPRSARDFFDALVALGMLERRDGRYANTRETDLYLDDAKPSYVGGFIEMMSARIYPSFALLTDALRSGKPQNEEARSGNADFFGELYSDPERLRLFLRSMTGVSLAAARGIAREFPWREHRTFFDVGTAQGGLPVQVALAHPHLTGGGFDLPQVRPVFEEYVASFGLQDRLRFAAGSFFEDPLPEADVIVLGHILHDWDLDEKRMLLRKAYQALPRGGAVVVCDRIIDDERRSHANGLLLSLVMLIETPGGFDYTGAECREWMREAGFRESRVVPLDVRESMVVGVK
ncbi:MAG: methyltransferase [Thermodesulfobacteriota bacterium]